MFCIRIQQYVKIKKQLNRSKKH